MSDNYIDDLIQQYKIESLESAKVRKEVFTLMEQLRPYLTKGNTNHMMSYIRSCYQSGAMPKEIHDLLMIKSKLIDLCYKAEEANGKKNVTFMFLLYYENDYVEFVCGPNTVESTREHFTRGWSYKDDVSVGLVYKHGLYAPDIHTPEWKPRFKYHKAVIEKVKSIMVLPIYNQCGEVIGSLVGHYPTGQDEILEHKDVESVKKYADQARREIEELRYLIDHVNVKTFYQLTKFHIQEFIKEEFFTNKEMNPLSKR